MKFVALAPLVALSIVLWPQVVSTACAVLVLLLLALGLVVVAADAVEAVRRGA